MPKKRRRRKGGQATGKAGSIVAFASYSRKDAPLVRTLLNFFAAIDVPTFFDQQSIKPGQKWRVEINAALEQCQTILVFWCEHAVQSSEVRREYDRAILLGKRVVPVLIDHASLPPGLAQYQGVDLRMFLSERHEPMIDRLIDRLDEVGGFIFGAFPDPDAVSIGNASQQLKSFLTAEFGEYTSP